MPKIVEMLLEIYGFLRIEDRFEVSHKLWWEPSDFLHASILLFCVKMRKQRKLNFMYDVIVVSRYISRDKLNGGSNICILGTGFR